MVMANGTARRNDHRMMVVARIFTLLDNILLVFTIVSRSQYGDQGVLRSPVKIFSFARFHVDSIYQLVVAVRGNRLLLLCC